MTGSETGAADAEHGGSEDWSYDGATGPAHWASLSEAYAPCDGDAQSPVDITGAQPDDRLPPLQVSYAPAPAQRDPSGHVTHVDVEGAGALTFRGRRYTLDQFHFHTPSEHTIEGQSFAAEAHFVHEDDAGAVAVLAVMIEEGAESDMLRRTLSERDVQIDPGRLLPADLSYYTYVGSLTTPPCTEGVRWIVLRAPATLSPAQVERMKGDHTNRPVQPLNGRRIAMRP